MTSPTIKLSPNATDDNESHGSHYGKPWLLTTAWAVNAILLIAGFAYIYFDGRSKATIDRIFTIYLEGNWSWQFRDNPVYLWCAIAATLAAVAACTLITVFVGLFVGGLRFRSTRMWLLFSALVAGWLALVVAWPELYWRGQQRRMRAFLPAAEATVANLNSNWPKDDGELPAVGQFQAYPKGQPTLLMPLARAQFPNTDLRFLAVERSATDRQVVRFQLSPDESYSWLEWRSDDSLPESFVGGVNTEWFLQRQHRLAPRWFLARYSLSQHVPPGLRAN